MRKEDDQMTLRATLRSFDMKPQVWAVVILLLMTAGCAVSEKSPSSNRAVQTADSFADDDFGLMEEKFGGPTTEVKDPLESLNRMMFQFNDALYFCVLKPTAQLYKGVAPEPARIGVRNFFDNLTTPVRFVSSHLQGKPKVADVELKRFLINTTQGILGFGDPAKDQHSLEPPQVEDLGQALAVQGFGNGFYVVWPLFGPSTARDSVGLVGGWFLNPVFYVEHTETAISITATRITNEGSFRIGEYETFKAASLDPYVAMRQAYIQYRNKKIKE